MPMLILYVKNTFLDYNLGSYLQCGLFSFLSKIVTLKKNHKTGMKLIANHLNDSTKVNCT